MDDVVDDNREAVAAETLLSGEADADRAPNCPVCHRRLAILNSRMVRTEAGGMTRRQLWGCPRGHAPDADIDRRR